MYHSDAEIRGPTPRTTPVRADAASTKAAEDKVPLEWDVDDVILDLYEVKQVHRTGGMGLVYRVHHRNWNIDLAVKSPRYGFFEMEEQKDDFVSECETWINLGLHPNTVSCYYVRNLGRIPRVFAEYVEGGSLKEWIDNRELYEGGTEKALERILDTAIQFAWGLHFAHDKGLVHQDVKPANVMMTKDGTAKVTDFGLAKTRAMVEKATGSGPQQSILVSCGGMTPAYCSPEQANMQQLSHKTDIWSWGLSVLHMFSGKVIWRSGQQAPEKLEFYLKEGPQVENIPPMPVALVELLRQCFQKDPEARPHDFGVVASTLQDIYRQAIRREYPRPEPKPAELLADALNNHAISMLDLGQQDKAESLLEEALGRDPHHIESTYNRGLLLWRSGRLTDDQLVQQLEELRKTHTGSWKDEYLLGLVHIERGDAESAIEVLEEALEQSPESDEVKCALTTARNVQGKLPSRMIVIGALEWVTSVSTRDGWALVANSRTLHLWKLFAEIRCVRILEGHTNTVNSVAIRPDIGLGLSGSDDKTLRLWVLGTGVCMRVFEGHTGKVNSVSIGPDGSWGLSGSDDKTLRLWQLYTGKCIRVFKGHTGKVNSVSISPDGRWGLSGSADKTLRLWELSTGKCIRIFEGNKGQISSVTISMDGRLALSGGSMLRLWDLASGRCARELEGHGVGGVTAVSISTDGRWGLSGSWDETVRLWDLVTGRCVRTFGHGSRVTSVSINQDNQWGLSGTEVNLRWLPLRCSEVFGTYAVAVPRSASELSEVTTSVLGAIEKAKLALKQGRVSIAAKEIAGAREFAGYERDSVLLELWREIGLRGRCHGLSGGWFLREFEEKPVPVSSISISPDSRWGLSGSWALFLWELATGRCIRTFREHNAWVRSVSISPDGCLGLSGGDDNALRLWELGKGACVRVFKGHQHRVNAVAISPDGRWGLSGSEDRTLRLWEFGTGACMSVFKGHVADVNSVSISPAGRWGLSGSADKTLRLWELANGKCIRTLEGHTEGVHSVCFAPDGRWGLSGSYDKTLRLWELSTGKCIRIFEGHKNWVSSVGISPDGFWAISGGGFITAGDCSIRLWHLATGRCVRIFEGHTSWVLSVSISRDCRWVLSGSFKGALRLWELVWDYEFPEPTDWDEGARPYLEIFLTLHCAYGEDGISRVGKPVWNDEDFKKLLKELQKRGYGWLRPEGMRKKLEEMTANWQGPSRLSEID